MCEHFRFVSQNHNINNVGRDLSTIDHHNLNVVDLFVLQFSRKDSDSEESLAIPLILK